MRVRILVSMLVATSFVGCRPATGMPSEGPHPTIYVRAFSGDVCLLAGAPPPPVTIRILPGVPWLDQIQAVDGAGRQYAVWWAPGFSGGTLDDPAVRDRSGVVAARDGDQLDFAAANGPTLRGYEVCFGSEALWVLAKKAS